MARVLTLEEMTERIGSTAPLTAAEQKEIRAMALSMIEKGCTEEQVRDAMNKAALLYRELKVVSAGPAKATK